MNNIEKIEFEALRYAGVPELPEERGMNDGLWTKAIAVTRTHIGAKSYAIVRANAKGAPSVIKVFDQGGIARIESVHPYEFLVSNLPVGIVTEAQLRSFLAKEYQVTEEEMNAVSKEKFLELYRKWELKASLDREKARKEREEKVAQAKAEKEAMKAQKAAEKAAKAQKEKKEE